MIHAQYHGGERHDRGVHRGHRDVPVPRALAVEVEQLRRQLAADVERGQPGVRGAGGDQLRTADPGHRLRHAFGAQRFDADQRILAAADRDQRMLTQAECWRRRFCSPDKANGRIRGSGNLIPRVRFAYPGYREPDPSSQIQPIAIGKLTQPVEINGVQQCRSSGIDGVTVDADLRGHCRLVVAHAGDQVQQAQSLLRRLDARRVQFERRTGQGHRLDQLRAVVEGVDQPRHAGGGIEAATHEAERANRVAIEHPVTHCRPHQGCPLRAVRAGCRCWPC